MITLELSMIKRSNSRSNYWTQGALSRALKRVGAVPEPWNDTATMIWAVRETFATKEEAVARRAELTRALESVPTRGRVARRWAFTEVNQ